MPRAACSTPPNANSASARFAWNTRLNPKAGCFQCHEDHAAVEHNFVQFYPTLKPVAKKFGTYRQERENVDGAK